MTDSERLTDIMGREPDAEGGGPMLSTAWTCGTCDALALFRVPSPSPAPCKLCGGKAFSCQRVRLN